jgi:hypothetical protein
LLRGLFQALRSRFVFLNGGELQILDQLRTHGREEMYNSPATSMTAATANANMPKTRSCGSSIASKKHENAAIAFGYPRER